MGANVESTEAGVEASRKPVKVIYILGWGHSGSTLLDLTLGTAPNVVSVGEVIFFDFYRTETAHPKVLRDFECTCGQKLRNCSLWQGAMERMKPEVPKVVYDQSGVARLGWVAKLIGYRLFGNRRRAATNTGDDRAFFEGVLGEAGAGVEFVSDSSKDFARLARLLMQPGIEVYPVHLVRDIRAVASSYSKPVREELGLNKVGYFRATWLWVFINLLSWFVMKLSGRPTFSVSYDLLCQDPERTLKALSDHLGIDLDVEHAVQQISRTEYHNVGGNLMRFKTIESIRYDESWKKRNRWWQHSLTNGMFGLFNLMWVKRDSVPR